MKNIQIIRYGKLLPVKQTGNFSLDGFHNAPVEEGYYCFNKKFFESFLVGDRMYRRDLYHAEICGGTLWIHLDPPKRNMILQQSGSWNLIRAEDYHSILKSLYNSEVTYLTNYDGHPITQKYAKDHLELFCTKDTKLTNVRKAFNKYKTRGREKSSEIEDLNWQKEYDRIKYYTDLSEKNDEKDRNNDKPSWLLE